MEIYVVIKLSENAFSDLPPDKYITEVGFLEPIFIDYGMKIQFAGRNPSFFAKNTISCFLGARLDNRFAIKQSLFFVAESFHSIFALFANWKSGVISY